jgi:protein-disulfide isomerase
MNCDLVAASPFSELFLGLPVSSFAAGWFLALFLVSLVAHNPFWRRECLRGLLALTLFGSLISLPYLWIMTSQLKTFCLLCLGIDAVNWISLGLAVSLKPEGFSKHKPEWAKWKVILPLVGFSVFASVFGLKAFDQLSIRQTDIESLTQQVLSTPPVSIQNGEDLLSIGPKNAPITIVEFSDFQCPFCRIGAFTVNSVVSRYPGKIRVIFRNFPLDQSCNPLLQHTPHPVACEAARTAVCAYRQGKLESVYQELFENQALLSRTHPTELVKKIGLNDPAFQSCMSSPESLLSITKDIEEGKLLGVNSTPTFFINGHRMEGPYPVPVWHRVIDRLLSTR